VPNGAAAIDVGGRVVAPGLIDMHYHVITAAMRYRRSAQGSLDSTYDRALAERLLRVALGYGITTIRDPGASPLQEALSLRDDVAHGRVLGPRIFTAGPILNDPRFSVDSLRTLVRGQAAAGVDFVKVYAGLRPLQVRAVVEEAHRHGVRVIGHLQRTSWTEAARAGIDFLTHGADWHESELPDSLRASYREIGDMRQRIAWYEGLDVEGAAVDTMVREMATRRIPLDPTLVAYHTKFWWRDSIYQHDPDVALVPEEVENWRVLGMHTREWSSSDFDRVQAVWPKQLALVRRLYRAGVPIMTGSDLASPWVAPGVSLHQEFALLASAGLTPLEVLRAATYEGARALGIEGDAGTVAVGKRADLVVFENDVLTDMTRSRSIRFAILGGAIFRPKDLLALVPNPVRSPTDH
jgi:imidazolonepropionase-like amidohydrolase